MNVNVKAIEKYKQLYDLPKDTRLVVLIGGRGGGKTYEASKFIAFSSTIKNKRCVVVRDEKSKVRESILSEIFQRYDTANASGQLDKYFQKLDTGIKNLRTNDMQVFTMGFRASDNDKRANLKGVSNVDIAIIEEAEDIRDPAKFNTFTDSIRKKDSLIIIILNTPDVRHWIIKRYFNIEEIEDGYYKVVPKKIPGFVCIQSDFEDNEYLPDVIVEQYKSYGNPDSVNYDKHYYLTAIKGYASTGRRGQILKNVNAITLEDYLRLPFKEIYGQDFGTASPAAMVGCKFDRGRMYVRQLNYLPMSTLDIAKLYATLQLNKADRIVADHADAEAIKKLKHGFKLNEVNYEYAMKYPAILQGFNIVECDKKGGINARIGLLKSLEIYFVEESGDLWTESARWCYGIDKNGEYTDEPIDDFNHLIDALGYVAVDRFGIKNKFIIYG